MPRRQRRRPGWLGSRSGLAGPRGAGGRSLAFLSRLLVEYAVEALCADARRGGVEVASAPRRYPRSLSGSLGRPAPVVVYVVQQVVTGQPRWPGPDSRSPPPRVSSAMPVLPTPPPVVARPNRITFNE